MAYRELKRSTESSQSLPIKLNVAHLHHVSSGFFIKKKKSNPRQLRIIVEQFVTPVAAPSAGLLYRHNGSGTKQAEPSRAQNTTAAAVPRPVSLFAARLFSPSFTLSHLTLSSSVLRRAHTYLSFLSSLCRTNISAVFVFLARRDCTPLLSDVTGRARPSWRRVFPSPIFLRLRKVNQKSTLFYPFNFPTIIKLIKSIHIPTHCEYLHFNIYKIKYRNFP